MARRVVDRFSSVTSSRPSAVGQIRILAADVGHRGGPLVRQVDRIRSHDGEDTPSALIDLALAQAAEYLAGTAPFPERIHILGLVGKFMLDQTNLMADWARWARAEVERWPDVGRAEVSPEAVKAFQAALAEQEDAEA